MLEEMSRLPGHLFLILLQNTLAFKVVTPSLDTSFSY